MPKNSEKEDLKKDAWKHYLDYGTFPEQADVETLNALKEKLKEKAKKRIDPNTSDEVSDFLQLMEAKKDVE